VIGWPIFSPEPSDLVVLGQADGHVQIDEEVLEDPQGGGHPTQSSAPGGSGMFGAFFAFSSPTMCKKTPLRRAPRAQK
jgi:hypothetical protein